MSINEDPDILPEGDQPAEENDDLLTEAPMGEESDEVPPVAKVQPVD